tara:strand:+ start:687 stop:1214 length:528 start_codon:yes stop_codon:yes gene_type:complete
MANEITSVKLPDKWGPEDSEDKNSPRLYMKNTIGGIDLPISGGWGYSKDDCVVIDKKDPIVDQRLPFNGVEIEYVFAEKRIYAELIVLRRGEKFSGIKWDLSEQRLEFIDNKRFDILNFRVTAFPDQDWSFLKQDWESNNGFVEDKEGRDRHDRERRLRSCFYDAEYWFDITSFF